MERLNFTIEEFAQWAANEIESLRDRQFAQNVLLQNFVARVIADGGANVNQFRGQVSDLCDRLRGMSAESAGDWTEDRRETLCLYLETFKALGPPEDLPTFTVIDGGKKE